MLLHSPAGLSLRLCSRAVSAAGLSLQQGIHSSRAVSPGGLSLQQGFFSSRAVSTNGLSLPTRAFSPAGLCLQQGSLSSRAVSSRAISPAGLSLQKGCLSSRAVSPSRECSSTTPVFHAATGQGPGPDPSSPGSAVRKGRQIKEPAPRSAQYV